MTFAGKLTRYAEHLVIFTVLCVRRRDNATGDYGLLLSCGSIVVLMHKVMNEQTEVFYPH